VLGSKVVYWQWRFNRASLTDASTSPLRARRGAAKRVRPQLVTHRLLNHRAALMLAAAMAISAAASADQSQRLSVVVCTSEANGPWIQKAQGIVVRTTVPNETVYKFEAGETRFEWRFMTSPQGNTTAIGPGFLTERFVTKGLKQAPGNPHGPLNGGESASDLSSRRQTLDATGEIHERDETIALALLIGSNCSKAGRRLRPNSTAESDARKSGARGSP
jgi:hypothetical protein